MGDHGSYSGNGYVYEFRGRLNEIQRNLSELHRLEWIDNSTRAIFIQMSLYNPNVQLFTSVMILAEILSTGGINPTARFEPMNFTGDYSRILFEKEICLCLVFTSQIQLICLIIYMIFIIYFLIKEIQTFLQMKRSYFSRFQSYIELGLIIFSWTSVAIYIWRYRESKRISRLFGQTNSFAYINLQLASYINDLLTYILSLCCFFGTIKLTHLCRFNQRLLLFSQTLQNAGRALISFAAMFSVVFVAFLCLFYFLFNSRIQSCSSLLETTRMLFEISLMKFDAHGLIDADAFLGPLAFSLYILIVVFVCMSMFLSIINDSFRQARDDVHRRIDEQLFSLTIDKFLRWIGKTRF